MDLFVIKLYIYFSTIINICIQKIFFILYKHNKYIYLLWNVSKFVIIRITFAIIVSGAVSTGFVVLNNLASLMNKAISLLSNKRILDMQGEMLQTMQLKNEVIQETVDTFKKMKEINYKQYVDELQGELGKLADGEEKGMVSKSLEKLANLINKGVEIHTSIETPKEIKVLFPFAETHQSLPEGLTKYIEDKISQDNNE